MKFGYFCNTTNWNHKPYHQLLDETKEITEFCDQNKWNSIWFTEHHFNHEGIERGFFTENQVCISKETPVNERDLLDQLIDNEKSGCKEVRFKLFKLSLSELNLIANIVFLLICVHIMRHEKKQKN